MTSFEMANQISRNHAILRVYIGFEDDLVQAMPQPLSNQ